MPRLGTGIALVGRRRELDVLVAALEHGALGRAGGVLLSGDAGVGKSRLIVELARRASTDGWRVLTGRCLDTAEAALPYLPFAEAVGPLSEDADLLAAHPTLARLLPGTVDRGEVRLDRPDVGQLQLFDAVLSALTTLATRGPVLLIVEDLHWADRSSRDLLTFLLARLGGQRLVVLASYRADELNRRHPLRQVLAELVRLPSVDRLELTPFGAADAERFVRALADDGLDDTAARSIARRSEGNAFFAEELVSADTDGMPGRLAEVLLARVETLDQATQQVLRLASVAGRRFRHDRLAAASAGTSPEDLDAALRAAASAHVLLPDGTRGYQFRHALLREALYADLLPGERTRLHAAFATALTDEPDRGSAAELAHHAMESHDLPLALASSVRAAREADQLDASAEILLHAERALQLWAAVPDPRSVAGEDPLELMRLAVWSADALGEPDRAIRHCRAAIELADSVGDTGHGASFRRRYGQYLLALPGRELEALAAAEEAFDLLADEPASPEKAWALAGLARVSCRLDRYAEATEQAYRAIELASESERGPAALAAEADALTTAAVSEEMLGRVDSARERLDRAIALAAEADALGVELRARFNAGMSRHDAGELLDAMPVFDAGVARAERTGMTWSSYGLELRVMQALTRYILGDWDGAASITEGSVSAHVATRVSSVELFVEVGRGQFEAADARIAALPLGQGTDEQVVRFVAMCGAEMELWRGAPDRAAAHVRTALEDQRRLYGVTPAQLSLCALGVSAQSELARLARLRRDDTALREAITLGTQLAELATTAAEQAQPRTGTLGPEGRAWLLRVDAESRSLIGDPDPGRWADTAVAFDAYGEVYQAAMARWRHGEALLATQRSLDSAEPLRQALAVAERLGATPLAEAVRATASRGRVRLGAEPLPVPPSGPTLTPRERSVLELVAAGRTNRQIGTELYISEKTVSVHLSRVMSKLAVSSRTEAVSAAYRLSWLY
ncbi:helix-turn-helix transcriptional regulator [Pseudonocardia spinosispora]|uniref:helix-turn-helix transcriptional regulator n=1 Tax=Pseudonocardia spinosispora TaxID=103441 RepID=UPI000415870C|nr:helix-turn-helix transcriptional regulator [Pseudonocardia spinosispora]